MGHRLLHDEAVSALRPRPGDRVVGVGDGRHAAAPARLRTLLGSCVAVTWWHPRLHVAAMVHVAGPRRGTPVPGLERPPGWFADVAVPRAGRWAARLDPDPDAWQVKVFGGGRQFTGPPGRRTPFDVPAANLAEVRARLASDGVEPVAWHVGGTGPRIVVLDVHDGSVWLSHTPKPALGDGDPALRAGRRRSGRLPAESAANPHMTCPRPARGMPLGRAG